MTIILYNRNFSASEIRPNAIFNILFSKVLIAGYQTQHGHQVAALWKNGQPSPLALSAGSSAAHAVQVAGHDVFVAGAEAGSGPSVGRVWKNGKVALSLTGPNSDVPASIALSGRDVYLAGNQWGTTGRGYSYACLWKNGAAQLLGGQEDSQAFAVCVRVT